MQTLNPISMELCGQSLIEASAGTGKTYTITGLYLRYLLGLQKATHEDGTALLNTPLSVEQILVVTFTEAATQEIKDRVRARIINARDALLGKNPEDELISQIIMKLMTNTRRLIYSTLRPNQWTKRRFLLFMAFVSACSNSTHLSRV